jgi:hypothetical protein
VGVEGAAEFVDDPGDGLAGGSASFDDGEGVVGEGTVLDEFGDVGPGCALVDQVGGDLVGQAGEGGA